MPQALLAAAAQKFPPSRCWNHTPEPRAATGLPHPAAGSIGVKTLRSLRSLRPSHSPALRAGSGPLPASRVFASSPYGPPGDICPYGVQPRAATGFDTNASSPLVGATKRPKKCKSLPWNFCEGVAVAGPWHFRRRWWPVPSQVCVFGVTCDAYRPQEQKNVAGAAFFAGLRHFGIRPAALRRGTCDVFGPVTFATRLQKPSSTFALENDIIYGKTSS